MVGGRPYGYEHNGLASGTLVDEFTPGEHIRLIGRVLDGEGEPVPDAMLEIWQADAGGLYNSPEETRGRADPHFVGWGRQPTDGTTGEYRFETIKPGRVAARPAAPVPVTCMPFSASRYTQRRRAVISRT